MSVGVYFTIANLQMAPNSELCAFIFEKNRCICKSQRVEENNRNGAVRRDYVSTHLMQDDAESLSCHEARSMKLSNVYNGIITK